MIIVTWNKLSNCNIECNSGLDSNLEWTNDLTSKLYPTPTMTLFGHVQDNIFCKF